MSLSVGFKRPYRALYDKDDTPAEAIAYIEGGRLNGQCIWLDANARGKDVLSTRIDLPLDCKAWPEASHDKSVRRTSWAVAPSGAGKSTMIREYAKRYRAIHGPHANIILISMLDHDKTIKTSNEGENKLNIKRLNVKSLLDRELTLDEISEGGPCLVAFDDVEGASKDIAEKINALKDTLAAKGRHEAVDCIFAQHLVTDGPRSRLLLGECSRYWTAPRAVNEVALKRLYGSYGGLSNRQITEIKRLPSRWCILLRGYPGCVLHSAGAYLPHSEV